MTVPADGRSVRRMDANATLQTHRDPVAYAYRADGTLRPIYSVEMARRIESTLPERFAGWYLP